MKMNAIIYAVIAACCIFSVPVVNHGQDRRVLSDAQRITGDKFTVATTTPNGAKIYAVSRPSAVVLRAIDTGLSDLFAVARKNGYRKRLTYADYTVYIARADRTRDSQGQYSPDIAVGAAQYSGSVYDQGGFVYAAGMVVSTASNAFVIAEHTRQLDRVSNVVRYEGEHLVLYHNDRRRFLATQDHSQGGGHPILQ